MVPDDFLNKLGTQIQKSYNLGFMKYNISCFIMWVSMKGGTTDMDRTNYHNRSKWDTTGDSLLAQTTYFKTAKIGLIGERRSNEFKLFFFLENREATFHTHCSAQSMCLNRWAKVEQAQSLFPLGHDRSHWRQPSTHTAHNPCAWYTRIQGLTRLRTGCRDVARWRSDNNIY